LKLRGYDFQFSFAHGTHNPAHGAAKFSEEMIWLWRGYDPAKSEQTYQQDDAERAKPLFRVTLAER
jgi:enterochelin esterase family protein